MRANALRDLVTLLKAGMGNDHVNVIDLGGAGGLHPRWEPFTEVLSVVGFEPDERAFVSLSKDECVRWINCAVAGSEGPRTLHLTRQQVNSSLLRPNFALLETLQWCPDGPCPDFDILREATVPCQPLDLVLEREGIHAHALKLDTQGTELEILHGARKTLKDQLFLVETEVEFVPIYETQPLFSDVDAFMRAQGFVLVDLGGLLYVKPRGCATVGGPKGTLIAGDALYLRAPGDAVAVCMESPERVFQFLVVLLAYGYPDLGVALLTALRARGASPPGGDALEAALRACKPITAFPWLPWRVRSLVARAGRRLSRRFQEAPGHSLWLNGVGNILG